MADLSDEILEAAQNPQRTKGDMGEVEEHDLSDLIKADQYVTGKDAVITKNRGLRFTKLVPPGATD